MKHGGGDRWMERVEPGGWIGKAAELVYEACLLLLPYSIARGRESKAWTSKN